MESRDSQKNRQFSPGVHARKPLGPGVYAEKLRRVDAAAKRSFPRIVQPHLAPLGLLWLIVGFAAGTLHAGPKPDEADTPDAKQAERAADRPGPNPAEELGLRQQTIAEKFRHLEKVLLRMAELSEASDPRRAALLKKAIVLSGNRHISVQFERLVELLRKDQVSRALENQADLDQDLHALLELLLSENRAKRIAAEKARIRNYLKRLNRIIKQQKDLQGRTENSGNPKSLSGRQGRLADETRGLAKDIKENEEGQGKGGGKEKSPGEGKGQGEGEGKSEGKGQGQEQKRRQDQDENPARKRLEAARQRMKEAQEKLGQAQREGAVERQEEAIRELQRAKAELEEILRQLREEEIMRMLAMLEVRFREMLRLQREVYEGTGRLDKVPKPERTRNHEIEASRLSGKETQLVLKADKALLLLREDGTAVAFPEAVEQMRDDMQQVVYRLAQAKVGQITQAIEEDIIAALEEMIEALKKAQKEMEEQQRQRPPRSNSQQPNSQQDPPLIDALAEVRMIRALQMRVNRRTQRYSKLIEGEQAEEPELVEALQRLAEREARIHRVTRDLAAGKNK